MKFYKTMMKFDLWCHLHENPLPETPPHRVIANPAQYNLPSLPKHAKILLIVKRPWKARWTIFFSHFSAEAFYVPEV